MNSIGIPFLTHSWIAEEEMVAPSVETITRSTSKKGRSEITSPFLLTTRRSLFFDTETPNPSTNISSKILSTGYAYSLVEKIMADAPDTIGPAQEALRGLLVDIYGLIEEGDELLPEPGATQDLYPWA